MQCRLFVRMCDRVTTRRMWSPIISPKRPRLVSIPCWTGSGRCGAEVARLWTRLPVDRGTPVPGFAYLQIVIRAVDATERVPVLRGCSVVPTVLGYRQGGRS